MDALMITLVGTLLTTPGGAWWRLLQRLTHQGHVAARFDWLLPGLLALPMIAAGGALNIAALLNPRALLIFQAMALIFAGATMLLPPLAPLRFGPLRWADRAARSRVGGIVTLGALLASDSALFIVVATAARTGQAWPAALGASIALLLVTLLARATPPDSARMRLLVRLRPFVGALLLVVGVVVALKANGRL